jgi:hypothetical protein
MAARFQREHQWTASAVLPREGFDLSTITQAKIDAVVRELKGHGISNLLHRSVETAANTGHLRSLAQVPEICRYQEALTTADGCQVPLPGGKIDSAPSFGQYNCKASAQRAGRKSLHPDLEH